MKYFESILGQSHALEFLQHALAHQKLSSAYLFIGQHGIGKRKTALAFAKTLNRIDALSTEYGQLIDEQQFADVRQIAPEGKFIKISQIQEALEWISLTAIYVRYKCLVIDQAEAMNKESANAFLKTLEEPPPNTVIILIAEHSEQLLETIVSRCQIVRFSPLSSSVIQQVLQERFSLPSSTIDFLSPFLMGNLQLEWIENVERIQQWQADFFQCLEALFTKNMIFVFEHLERWSNSKEEAWKFIFVFMECWCRDLIHLKQISSDSNLYHSKYQIKLEKTLQTVSVHHVHLAYQQIYIAKESLFFNANRLLTMQSLWLYWKNLFLTK